MRLDLLVCFQHNYAMCCGVMIKSLLYNNQSTDICVHAIIDPDVTDLDISNIQTVAEGHKKKCEFKFYRVDNSIISELPQSSNERFDRSVYYRLFASSILADDIEKVLYLDCDIIVTGSVERLWNYDLNKAIAGVVNQTQDFSIFNRLGYPSEKGYMNSGVLLINLKYWRDYHIESQVREYIWSNPTIIYNPDQDTINAVLCDNHIDLPLIYNVQSGFLYKKEYLKFNYWGVKVQLDEAINNPVVIHYTGWDKPWMKTCFHPYKDLFTKYKTMTIWNNCKSTRFPFGYIFKNQIKRLLSFVGIIDYTELRYMYKEFRNNEDLRNRNA